MNIIKSSLVLFIALSMLTGLAYPILVTISGSALFPEKVSGSLIKRDGVVVGSELIGQNFTAPSLFWSRPSATSPTPYNGASSSGSNLSVMNVALHQRVAKSIEEHQAMSPAKIGSIPIDLVTASASGLDPHISPAAALFQIDRISKETGISTKKLNELVTNHIEERFIGLLGERRVNVLVLNIALLELIAGGKL